MITLTIAIAIAVVIAMLGIFTLRNFNHPQYAHIISVAMVALLSAYLALGFINGNIGVESTAMVGEKSSGYVWNVTNTTTNTTDLYSNTTTAYTHSAVMQPIQNPSLTFFFAMIAVIAGAGFVYFVFVAWYGAAHPEVDPYEVDEGVD